MTTRILPNISLVAIIPGLDFYLTRALVTENVTDLALRQMNEDDSRERLRSIKHLSNWIDVDLILTGILYLIFRRHSI